MLAPPFYFLSRHAQNTFSLSLIVEPAATHMHPQFFLFLLAKGTREPRGDSTIRTRPIYAPWNAHLSNCSLGILFFQCTHARTRRLFLEIGIRSRHWRCESRSRADVPFRPRLVISGYAVAQSINFILIEISRKFCKIVESIWEVQRRNNSVGGFLFSVD